MSAPAKAAPRWISVRAASQRIGLPPYKIQRLIDCQAVEALHLPRSRPMVSAADLDRLAKEAIRPAITT
jgi:hypothetical protein